jgi:hypothetical protein
MIKLLKRSATVALSIITAIFAFVPETVFGMIKLLPKMSDEINIILNRVFALIIVFILSIIVNSIYFLCRRKIFIKGNNYKIKIQYGNLFKMHNCKKIIPFDECFTTSVGDSPADIKHSSICGQYLDENPISDMQGLIDKVQLKPMRSRSQYKNKPRYELGRLVPKDDYLLMPFTKLNQDGLGIISRKEYLDCLSTMWEEIDKYYGQKDVCISILGSGTTRMNGELLTQQQLLDMIIVSYKLSSHKIKLPNKLIIVCRRNDDFSINKIGEYI